MANKHSPLTRSQVEVAAACGVPGRQITAALGVARTCQDRWTKQKYAAGHNKHVRNSEKRNPAAKSRAYKKWRINNLGAHSQYQRRLRGWPASEAESLMIKYRYEDVKRLTAETGVAHEVDHIWPISKGGPHLPWNLQVLTKEANRSKGSKIVH